MKWVSVKDDLPEDQKDIDGCKEVLVLVKDKAEFAVFRHGKFLKRDWLGEWRNVTHWAEIEIPQ